MSDQKIKSELIGQATGNSALNRAILAVLAVLVVMNGLAAILLRVGGPLLGAAVYLVLLVLTLERRPGDHHMVVLGGVAGLVVHVAQLAVNGWAARLLLVALNVILPATLIALGSASDRA